MKYRKMKDQAGKQLQHGLGKHYLMTNTTPKTRRTFTEYLLQTKRWEMLSLQNNEEKCESLWRTVKYRNA